MLAGGVLAGWVALRTDESEPHQRATVVEVVDGDTIVVADAGRRDRVRILGIDTPEAGRCLAREATQETRTLALGRTVELQHDESQRRRDRFGRRLAYVRLPDGRDLGFQLIAGGLARAFVVGEPFERLETYRRAEILGRRQRLSVWRC